MEALLVFIIILGLLVLSHEYGHFIIAKKSGMRVLEFGFGFPPRLFSFQKGETVYSFNLIPFGGFVKIYGEDGDEEDYPEDAGRKFTAKSRLAQAGVTIAGVAFNLLLAWVLLFVGFIVGFPTVETDENRGALTDTRILVTQVVSGSPAESAGISLSEEIKEISAGAVARTPDTPDDVVLFIEEHQESDIVLTLARGEATRQVTVRPASGIASDKKAIGISTDTIGLLRATPPVAVFESFTRTVELTVLTARAYYGLARDALFGEAELAGVSGPIGIYTIVAGAQDLGLSFLIGLTALISINLALINMIPFPALDGGRLVLIAVEAVRRKSISKKVTTAINATGFVLLIILMLVVTYNDLIKIGVFPENLF